MSTLDESLRPLARRIVAGTLSADEAMRAVVDAITASIVGSSDDPELWSATRRQVLAAVRADPELLDMMSATRWRPPPAKPSQMPAAPAAAPAPVPPPEAMADEPLFEGASQSRVARVVVGSVPIAVVTVVVVGLVAWGATIFSGDDPPAADGTAAAGKAGEPTQKAAVTREPMVVAAALAPSSVVIDDAWVWYTTAQPPGLGRVRSIGGELQAIAAEADPLSLAQTEEHLVWLSRTPTGPLLRAIHKRAPTVAPETLDVAPMRPAAPSLWQLELAFVDETDGAIARKSLEGGAPTKLTGALQPRPSVLASDATAIAWAAAGTGATVGVIAREGGAPAVLATDQVDPRGLVLDETHAWWVDAGAGALRRVPRQGGAVETMVAGGVDRFALDRTSIWWTDPTAGTVSSRAREGGEPKVVASGQAAPSFVLVDGAAVYWVGGGRLMRLPK